MKHSFLKKISALLLSGFLLSSVLTGCGSSSASSDELDYEYGYEASADAYDDGDIYSDEAFEGDMTTEESSSTETDTISESDTSATSRKLIYYRYLTVQTTTYDDLYQKINSLIDQYGAYIETSEENGTDLYGGCTRYCSMTIRVPNDSLDAFESSLREEMGSSSAVISRSQNVEDITLNYTDVESRISSLKAEQERLTELMEQAEDIDDVLAIETQLSDIRYQLEDYESQKRLMDSQVTYSYLNLEVDEVEQVEEPVNLSIGQRILNAWGNSVAGIKDGAANLLVFLIGNILYLLVLALVIFLVVFLVRKISRKKKTPVQFQNPVVMPPVTDESSSDSNNKTE